LSMVTTGSEKIISEKNELLSICIPTYNHAEPLRKSLEAMIPQAREYNIPIYISDNASTDQTIKILETFKKDYPLLYFQSNKNNVGIDQNMINAARMASSKYIWTIGARRILLPGLLAKIYKILKQSDWDMVVLNDLNTTYKVPETQRYNSAQKVFRELHRNLTGLGFQILPKEAWKCECLTKYAGTEWTNLGLSLEYVAYKKNVNVFFLAEPCATSSGSSHWNPKTFKIWTDLKKVVRSLPDVYSAEDKELVISNCSNIIFIPRFGIMDLLFRSRLVDLRMRGIYDAKVFSAYREDLERYGNVYPTMAYVIARFPVPILKLYFGLYDGARATARLFIHSFGPLNPRTKRNVPYI